MRVYVCMCACVRLCVHVYVCVCMHMCVCGTVYCLVVPICYCLQDKSKFVEIKEECHAEDEQGEMPRHTHGGRLVVLPLPWLLLVELAYLPCMCKVNTTHWLGGGFV